MGAPIKKLTSVGLSGQAKQYTRFKVEVWVHIVLHAVVFSIIGYLFFSSGGVLKSQAEPGKVINMPAITQAYYELPEVMAFTSKSLGTYLDYNFIDEELRMRQLSSVMEEQIQLKFIALLRNNDLYPLSEPAKVSFEPETAPLPLPYQANIGQPYSWAFEIRGTFHYRPLIKTKEPINVGPITLRIEVSRTTQSNGGYLLSISDLVAV